jgi:hypothetical protein
LPYKVRQMPPEVEIARLKRRNAELNTRVTQLTEAQESLLDDRLKLTRELARLQVVTGGR